MASSDVIDYRLRKNKTIERHAIMTGLQSLQTLMKTEHVYGGLGSIWFVDFEMAFRSLNCTRFISLECDEKTYRRAKFNAPFGNIEVYRGMSYEWFPELIAWEARGQRRPWLIWLDYDGVADENVLDELRARCLDLPDNSILLATVNANQASYGSLALRTPDDGSFDLRDRMDVLFGSSFPMAEFTSRKRWRDPDFFAPALARAIDDVMASSARESGRAGGYVSAFNLHYRDGTPMITVGGVLPSPSLRASVENAVKGVAWPGFRRDAIHVPPLTPAEVRVLRRMMPATIITRQEIREAGFDLEQRDIDAFLEHYLLYPTFAQLSE